MIDLLRNMNAFSEVILFLHHIGQAFVRNVEKVDVGLHISFLQQSGAHILESCNLGLFILLGHAVHHGLRHFALHRFFDG